MRLLVDYPWPGNVRELRNLIESMVVLAPGHEIMPEDLPAHLREQSAARLLPVAVGSVLRAERQAEGREFEFIVRSLVELKLQVEELRRRMDDDRTSRASLVGEMQAGGGPGLIGAPAAALEAREPAPPNVVTVMPGMTMAQIERAAIEAALRETGGNRRRAAELLGIGERTLYRKLHEYHLTEADLASG